MFEDIIIEKTFTREAAQTIADMRNSRDKGSFYYVEKEEDRFAIHKKTCKMFK